MCCVTSIRGTTASCPVRDRESTEGTLSSTTKRVRLADPDGPQDQGGQRVIAVVTGDSFVEALQVTHEDSFVSLLQDASPGPDVFSGTVVEADRVGTR